MIYLRFSNLHIRLSSETMSPFENVVSFYVYVAAARI